MGLEAANIPLGLDRKGQHSAHECFKIAFVMRNMRLKLMVEMYERMQLLSSDG